MPKYVIQSADGHQRTASPHEAVRAIASYPDPSCEFSEEEAREMLGGKWSKLHIGTGEDRFVVTKLSNPMKYDAVTVGPVQPDKEAA
ncbi:MAG: hypothetical protein AB7E51_15000 [Pseudodesulfovibrio sp.]|uniref:hypothetical protein n=1 Tax=Pseudodesulfovibrio sp. TaxID=2035812 RepID=UPI003D09879A